MESDLISGGVLITGATIGLGRSIAMNFLSKGSDVVICARDENNVISTVNNFNRIKRNDQKILAFRVMYQKLNRFNP